MILKRAILTGIFVFVVTLIEISAQDPTPQPTPSYEDQIKEIEDQKRVLEARKNYLNALRGSIPSSNIDLNNMQGKISRVDSPGKSTETVSLSYEALKEVSDKFGIEMKPKLENFTELVMYNEPDFSALAKYRIYRNQIRIAITNYESIVVKLESESQRIVSKNVISEKSLKLSSLNRSRGGVESLVTAFNIPAIGTSYAKSIAELMSLFRSDQVITQSEDTVDNESLGTVVAGSLIRANPNLKVYYPQKFVPDYEFEDGNEDSLYSQIGKLNQAAQHLSDLANKLEALSPIDKEIPIVKEIIAATRIVNEQVKDLSLASVVKINSETANSSGTANMSEFRRLLRAEKLDQILVSDLTRGGEQNRVGILKMRVISSGGNRRESKNLFKGTKVDYSGSVVIEVVLFEADGSLKFSDIFSYHTGFRKLQENKR